MANVLETIDKNGRTIHLSDERWKHIISEHPEVSPFIQEFKTILKFPTKIISVAYDDQVHYFYKYFKERKSSTKYLQIIVKYLNGNGFIITAYFVRTIQ